MLYIALFLFSFFDGIATATEISLGLATEANPVMLAVINVSGLIGLVLSKFVISLAGVAVLYRYRDRNSAHYGAIVLAVIFGLLSGYHVWILS